MSNSSLALSTSSTPSNYSDDDPSTWEILRVVVARNPPDLFSNCPIYPTFDPSLQCPFPGWTAEILKMVADALRLRIVPIVLDNEVGSLDWGTLQDNGNWSGALGYLQNNTADTVSLMYQMTDTRAAYYDYAYQTYMVQPVYIVRAEEQTIGDVLWNAFKPYSFVTWMFLLASLITQTAYMVFVTFVEWKAGVRHVYTPFNTVWHVMQLQFDERSDHLEYHTLSGNIVLYSFAMLQAGILVYLYEGLLLTALLRQSDRNPFANADEMIKLVASGKYHIVTEYIGLWYFDDMKHSNQSHFVALRAAVANNPVKIVESVEDALDLVDTGKYIYPVQQDYIAIIMAQSRCNYVYVTEGLPSVGGYYVFQRNSRFTQRWGKEMIQQTSFIGRTFDKYFMNGFRLTSETSNCPSTQVVEGQKPLNWESTVGIFMLGAIGLAMSVLIFVVELYVFAHKRVLKRRRRARSQLANEVRHLMGVAKIHFDEKAVEKHVRFVNFMDTLKEMRKKDFYEDEEEDSDFLEEETQGSESSGPGGNARY